MKIMIDAFPDESELLSYGLTSNIPLDMDEASPVVGYDVDGDTSTHSSDVIRFHVHGDIDNISREIEVISKNKFSSMGKEDFKRAFDLSLLGLSEASAQDQIDLSKVDPYSDFLEVFGSMPNDTDYDQVSFISTVEDFAEIQDRLDERLADQAPSWSSNSVSTRTNSAMIDDGTGVQSFKLSEMDMVSKPLFCDDLAQDIFNLDNLESSFDNSVSELERLSSLTTDNDSNPGD